MKKIIALLISAVMASALMAGLSFAEGKEPTEDDLQVSQESSILFFVKDAQQAEEYGNLDEMIVSLVSEDGVFRKIEYNDSLTEFYVYVDVQQYDPALDNASLYWLYPLSRSEQTKDPEALTEDQILINIIDFDTDEPIDTLTYGPSDEWICPACGNEASENYCSNCGTPKNGQAASTLGSIVKNLLSMILQGGFTSGGASTTGPSMTDVNDINTNINFFIYQFQR